MLVFSLVLFGEKLNLMQWGGVVLTLASLYMLSISGKKEGIDFRRSRGVLYMAVSVLSGVASALYDKHIMSYMEPLFVQGWTNLFITVLLGLCTLVQVLRRRGEAERFRWDWTLLLIAVLITVADYLYFRALSCEGALLSMISLTRRGSVIVTFFCGAMLFREQRVWQKAAVLGVMLAGLVLIVLGSG